MVGTAMNANAALYQVIEVSPEVNGDVVDYQTAYGVAIQQGDVIDASTDSPFALGCFDATANCTPEQFKLAVETRTTPISASQEVDGNSYREEIPLRWMLGFTTSKSIRTLSATVLTNFAILPVNHGLQ